MSQTEPTPATETETIEGPSNTRLLLAFTLALFITVPLGLLLFMHLADSAYEARDESLTEKYGVEIERIDTGRRDAEPVTWSVDGTKRECILSSRTLRCDDGNGTFAEIDATR